MMRFIQPDVILQRVILAVMLMKLSPVDCAMVDLPAPALIGWLIMLLLKWMRSMGWCSGKRRTAQGCILRLVGDRGCRAALHLLPFRVSTPCPGRCIMAIVEQNDLEGRLSGKFGVVVDAVERAHSRWVMERGKLREESVRNLAKELGGPK